MNKQIVREQLAPTGVLRAAINLSNFLLVTSRDEAGDPVGVSPAIARHLASKLGVPVKLMTYPGPGPLSDDVDNWDIGNIANEKERAKTIKFSRSYCNIQATYLVQPGADIHVMGDVDQPGVRIVAKARSAYDLWLTENIKHAQIIRTKTIADSFNEFYNQKYEVLAGLKPKLLEEATRLEGSRILPGSFTVIGQSVGIKKDRPEAAEFVEQIVSEAIDQGLVDSWIKLYGMEGKLSSR